MIRLYIDGKLADMDQSTSVNLTFKSEDIENPAAIKNTYSKTVALPASNNNNRIFDHIWNLSHDILNFDPSVRTEFVLTKGGYVIESGYIKLDSIEYDGQYPRSYNITLNGNRGNFFYSLIEDDEGEPKYLEDLNVNQSLYNHVVDAQSVFDSFTNENYRYVLSYSGQYDNFDSDREFTSFTDIGGIFDIAAGDGTLVLVSGFTYYVSTDNGETFTSYSPASWQTTGVYGKLIEYDSQTGYFVVAGPTGYVGSVPSKSIAYTTTPSDPDSWSFYSGFVTGYGDGDIQAIDILTTSPGFGKYGFFTTDGYYLATEDLTTTGGVFAARPTGVTAASCEYRPCFDRQILTSNNTIIVLMAWDGQTNGWTFSHSTSAVVFPFTQQTFAVNMATTGGLVLPVSGGTYMALVSYRQGRVGGVMWGDISGFLPSEWGITAYDPRMSYGISQYIDAGTNLPTAIAYGSAGTVYYMTASNPGGAYYVTTNLSTYPDQYDIYNIVRDTSTGYWFSLLDDGYGNTSIASNSSNISSLEWLNWQVREGANQASPIESQTEHERNEFRASYQRPALRLKNIITQILEDSGWDYTLSPGFFNESNPYWNDTWLIQTRLNYEGEPPVNNAGEVRTGDEVTFSQMIANGITHFKMLTDYIKMFGLIVYADKVTRHVTIQTKNEFYAYKEIVNWNNKHDYSKTQKIVPLPFDYKYGIFKQTNANSHYEDSYEEQFSREYGWTRVNTGYQFGNNEKVYIEDMVFQNVVMSTEYNRYFEGRNPDSDYADDKILPALFTRSNGEDSYNDSSMHMVFINGLSTLNTSIRITNDASDMLNYGLYMWNNSSTGTITTNQIPNVTRIWNSSYSLDFSRPENIYYLGDYPDSIGVYDRMYANYIAEILNKNNKVVTTYINLNHIDISNFGFNQFFVIGNNIWHILQIYDYNIDDLSSVKVDMIRIRDIDAYSNGQII